MFNDKQEEFFREEGLKKKIIKQKKSNEGLMFKVFSESQCYKEVKNQFLEQVSKPQKFAITQEGALESLCQSKYNEGLLEFFAIVERKARGAHKSY